MTITSKIGGTAFKAPQQLSQVSRGKRCNRKIGGKKAILHLWKEITIHLHTYILDSVIIDVINLYCLKVVLTLTLILKRPEVCNWNELQAKE